jgi:hypothetical protein
MTDLDQFDATLRRALDQADFSANRRLGPGTRVVQGDRRHIWNVIDKLLLIGARSEYLGLDTRR